MSSQIDPNTSQIKPRGKTWPLTVGVDANCSKKVCFIYFLFHLKINLRQYSSNPLFFLCVCMADTSGGEGMGVENNRKNEPKISS